LHFDSLMLLDLVGIRTVSLVLETDFLLVLKTIYIEVLRLRCGTVGVQKLEFLLHDSNLVFIATISKVLIDVRVVMVELIRTGYIIISFVFDFGGLGVFSIE